MSRDGRIARVTRWEMMQETLYRWGNRQHNQQVGKYTQYSDRVLTEVTDVAHN